MLDFSPVTPPVRRGVEAEGWIRYDTDAAEFLLRRLDADGGTAQGAVPVPDSGPRILLCTNGAARVQGADGDRVLERGQALWLGASDTGVTVAVQAPDTQLFLACDGLDG